VNRLECQDKDGVTVICTEDTWVNHIVAEHPEMVGCEAYVKSAIQSPFQIYQDGTDLKKRVFYTSFVLPKPFHTQYLRIVVEYRKNRLRGALRGYVCTAFACKNKKKGDILIWEKQA
jgi:hypothetical protein